MRPTNPGSTTQYFTKIAQGIEGLLVLHCLHGGDILISSSSFFST